jgi:hypothetical protein
MWLRALITGLTHVGSGPMWLLRLLYFRAVRHELEPSHLRSLAALPSLSG